MYQVSDDLILELCCDGDPPAMILLSKAMTQDAEAAGMVTIWPDEVGPLRNALADGLAVLANRVRGDFTDVQD